jgi:hypothetical protein
MTSWYACIPYVPLLPLSRGKGKHGYECAAGMQASRDRE